MIGPTRKDTWAALRRLGRYARSQRSQALVEFAMVSPIFLLVLFTAIDISRLLYTYTAVSSAARDGARTASLAGAIYSDCQIIQEVELVGQGFPVRMDPHSIVGNSDPNNPSGLLQPATQAQIPPNVAYAYIWPAVATAAPADSNCTSSTQRAVSPSVKHVAVEIQYHFTPLLPLVSTFASNIIVKTISVVTTE
ncbi:MAG TPA: TadE family protein [Candidatus Dormibacteraeota bacterium]